MLRIDLFTHCLHKSNCRDLYIIWIYVQWLRVVSQIEGAAKNEQEDKGRRERRRKEARVSRNANMSKRMEGWLARGLCWRVKSSLGIHYYDIVTCLLSSNLNRIKRIPKLSSSFNVKKKTREIFKRGKKTGLHAPLPFHLFSSFNFSWLTTIMKRQSPKLIMMIMSCSDESSGSEFSFTDFSCYSQRTTMKEERKSMMGFCMRSDIH